MPEVELVPVPVSREWLGERWLAACDAWKMLGEPVPFCDHIDPGRMEDDVTLPWRHRGSGERAGSVIAIVLGLLVPVIYIAWLMQGAIEDRLQARRDAAADD